MNYITRTIKSLEVTVKVADADTEQVYTTKVKIPAQREVKNLKSAVAKALPAGVTVLTVIDSVPNTALYGIAEAEFLTYAVELDPKTRKPIIFGLTHPEAVGTDMQ